MLASAAPGRSTKAPGRSTKAPGRSTKAPGRSVKAQEISARGKQRRLSLRQGKGARQKKTCILKGSVR